MQQTNIKVDSKIPRKKEAIVSKTWTTCDRPPTRLLTKCVVLDLTVPAHICAPHDLIKEKKKHNLNPPFQASILGESAFPSILQLFCQRRCKLMKTMMTMYQFSTAMLPETALGREDQLL